MTWVYKTFFTIYFWISSRATAMLVFSQKRLQSDAGEGVVSAAIAVLIFAFLGVMLWVAFKATMGTATNSVNAQVAQLGQ